MTIRHPGNPVIKYEPELCPPEKSSGLNLHFGRECLEAWIQSEPLALALRHWTTHADILAALEAWPHLIDELRPDPGPYSDYVAQHDASMAAAAFDAIAKLAREGK